MSARGFEPLLRYQALNCPKMPSSHQPFATEMTATHYPDQGNGGSRGKCTFPRFPFGKWWPEAKSVFGNTLSPLRRNPRVVNFQRCERVSHVQSHRLVLCLVYVVMCVHPLRVAVLLCVLPYRTVALQHAVQSPSPTLCDPTDCSTPGLPVPHHVPESAQVHVHCIRDAVQPSHPSLLLLPSIFPSIRDFSNESSVCIRWPKYWGCSFSISPFGEYSGFISPKIDWFDLLAVQGTWRSLLQHHSSKASVLWCSAFFTVQVSQPYVTPGRP